MRIAYIGRWTRHPSDGVRAKVEAHAARWRRAGHDVALFGLPTQYERRPSRSTASALGLGTVATVRLRRAVRAFAPDVVYIRYGLFLPSLAPLQRRFASVVEFNSRDRDEAATRGGGARHALNELSRRSLFGGAGGIVCVTRELARDAAAFGKPTCVIANGAELDIEPRPARDAGSRPLAVFLVGVTMPRHGVDKLLELARAAPECDFALIGADEQALPGTAPENVQALPAMSRAAYAEILERADIGIGPLAMHRVGLHEGSPLKVREYLAHGLPTVMAYEDTDFADDDPWFILRLPNREDNVRQHAEDVRQFIADVRGRRVSRAEIADRLGADAKEAARLAFMAEVVSRGRPR